MTTESKVTEIFCIADDFCKELEVELVASIPEDFLIQPICRGHAALFSLPLRCSSDLHASDSVPVSVS